MALNATGLTALMQKPVNCDNLIDGDFEDSGDDTGDEYESD